ncbi:hypothetical protein NMY22_g15433 [Coprinellus aureogranulatus]|nr:hypothetical protein NMY22_g15433 [Coprinellus aureogranulatus]
MPPKRRRTERTDDPEPSQGEVEAGPAPQQCEELWFDDGNVVLQASNVQFKVHRGVLAKHSPIFSDLFQVPHPESEPTVEGCPVVELQDSEKDIKNILKALYGDQTYINTDEVLEFIEIAGMIRLGRKYEIQHLKDEGLRRLKRQYPSDLDEHGALDPDVYVHVGFNEPGPDGKELSGINSLFAVLNLAHEFSIRSILPAVYLDSARFPLDDILFDSDELLIPYGALRSCLYGREKLLRAWIERSDSIVVNDFCATKSVCKPVAQAFAQALRHPPPNLGRVLLPWTNFTRNWRTAVSLLDSLCHRCVEDFKTVHQAERQKLWDALPGYFKLPAWADLKDFDE